MERSYSTSSLIVVHVPHARAGCSPSGIGFSEVLSESNPLILIIPYCSLLLQGWDRTHYSMQCGRIDDYFLSALSITDLVSTDMHHLYNMQCFADISFLIYIANNFWDIYFDCKFKSMRLILLYLFSHTELVRRYKSPV